MLNPLNYPICLIPPQRLTPFSAWQEHIPFAMFLVDILRPKMFVELGTLYGDSYCAFCQAVKELKLDTRCYAVDTWQGDPHVGSYDSKVLADLRAHHDPLYGSFSRLIQSTFDAALEHFGEGTIDLLHIDGYHVYSAVKHDFETWFAKLSPRGVVLLHDINVREHDFGVRRFWEEVRPRYPHFEFVHGHGLGVIAVGKEQPKAYQEFLEASPDEVVRIRNFFHGLGYQLTLRVRQHRQDQQVLELDRQIESMQTQQAEKEQVVQQLNALVEQKQQVLQQVQAHLMEQEHELQTLETRVVQQAQSMHELTAQLAQREQRVQLLQAQLVEKEQTVTTLNAQIAAIMSSTGWGVLQVLRRIRLALAPRGSRRERFGKLLLKGLKLWRHRGMRVLLTRIFEKVSGKLVRRSNENNENLVRQTNQSFTREHVLSGAQFSDHQDGSDVNIVNCEILQPADKLFETLVNYAERMPALRSVTKTTLDPNWLRSEKRTNSLISVIIPSYNHAKFVRQAVLSVAQQTYKNIQLIVIEDGSSDDSVRIIEDTLKDIKLTDIIFITQKNQGAHNAINNGILRAKGEYITILNSDDYYHPSRLAKLYEFSKNCNYDCVFSEITHIDENDDPLDPSHPYVLSYRHWMRDLDNFPSLEFALLLYNGTVTSGNLFFKAILIEHEGLFKPYKTTQDWEFVLRALIDYELGFLREPLMSYRIHQTNTISTYAEMASVEAQEVLKEFFSTIKTRIGRNRLAPTPYNWPKYFEHYLAKHSLYDLWNSCESLDVRSPVHQRGKNG